MQAAIPSLLQPQGSSHPNSRRRKDSHLVGAGGELGQLQPWTRSLVPPRLYLSSPAAHEPEEGGGQPTENKAWLGPGRLAASSPPRVRGTMEADQELAATRQALHYSLACLRPPLKPDPVTFLTSARFGQTPPRPNSTPCCQGTLPV